VGSVRRGRVAKSEVRISRELKVPAGAIRLARLFEPLTHRVLAVVGAPADFEHQSQGIGLDDCVAVEAELPDLVTMAFKDRNLEIDEAQFLVVGVADNLQLWFTYTRRDISVVAVVRLKLFLVVVKFGSLVGTRTAKQASPDAP